MCVCNHFIIIFMSFTFTHAIIHHLKYLFILYIHVKFANCTTSIFADILIKSSL